MKGKTRTQDPLSQRKAQPTAHLRAQSRDNVCSSHQRNQQQTVSPSCDHSITNTIATVAATTQWASFRLAPHKGADMMQPFFDIQYAPCERIQPPFLQLKSYILSTSILVNISSNYIIYISIDGQWFSLKIPLFRILSCFSVIEL